MSWEGGGPGDTTALDSLLCADPASNPGYANGGESGLLTLQRRWDGFDTNDSSFDFVAANGTPGATNDYGTSPPFIRNLTSSPCFVTEGQTARVAADITDANFDITSVRVFYKLETAAQFDSVASAESAPEAAEATLPPQADQAVVQYYIVAHDARASVVKEPPTAPADLRSYRVGLQTIASIQVPSTPVLERHLIGPQEVGTATSDSCAPSAQIGEPVNVVGVVTHQTYEFSVNFFYLQQGTASNSGIKVFTSVASSFVLDLGDSVRVSGVVDEFRCQTEVVLRNGCGTVLGRYRHIPVRALAPVSDIGKEENESMLVTIGGPIQAATAFDSTNFGSEFKVRNGANIAYVGDDTFFPDGIGYSTVPASGMILDRLTGVVGYRVVDTTPPRSDANLLLRLEPRRDNDADRDYTDVVRDGPDVVKALELHQNRPNPFNPVTLIEFSIPQACRARLDIYDAAGGHVRTLFEREYAGPARDIVAWNGCDDRGESVGSGLYFYRLEAGDRVASRRMIFVK